MSTRSLRPPGMEEVSQIAGSNCDQGGIHSESQTLSADGRGMLAPNQDQQRPLLALLCQST